MASQSLVQTAYTVLKDRIVSGVLAPGALLSENELADELQMSRTPVRNAITHLESEGFVVSLKNRGVLVKEISEKETMDMFEATMALLVYTLDVKGERGIALHLDMLEECLRKQIEAEEADDYLSYMRHFLLFIKAVVSSIGNQAMLDTLDRYADKIVRAAYLNYKNTPYIKHYSANQFNRSLLAALKAGDDEEARRIAKSFHQSSRSRSAAVSRF